ncbi:MAG: bifunctional oligoribonuclease/PAP phosphatase NrnA [Verrucomicrobiota bacterium]|nr:bifunctional oligoribonuclease/PAP phosphatase NrnA [Verrucomicrobiota bacterium]
MKRRLKIIDRILDALKDCRTFAICGHMRPDGDCIGSQLALAYSLHERDRKVIVWNQDPMPEKLAFLDPKKLLATPKPRKSFDAVITTDCANYERLGTICSCIEQRGLLINIDHHSSNSRYGDINWINARSASTGELIHQLIKQAGWPITPLIADNLFTAISTDTGSFQYPTTRSTTYHAAAELVTKGADLATICTEVYQSYPLSRVRLLKHMYNNFKLSQKNQVAYFWIRRRDYARAGAIPDESEGLIDHIRDIETVKVACLFEEIEPEITRISLRSKAPAIDVSAIALAFGGGGHQAAAGARIPGNPRTVQRQVLKAVKDAVANGTS